MVSHIAMSFTLSSFKTEYGPMLQHNWECHTVPDKFPERLIISATENMNITREVAPSIPPSSYDRVSVAAENLVGVGAARTYTTQPISELYRSHFSCYSV